MKPAKECVTTHLPNGLAPKMDCVEANDRYLAACVVLSSRRVGGRMYGLEAGDTSCGELVSSADLGGSSKYSTANFED